MTKTLSDIAHAMKDIDFCTLTSRSQDGSIGGRPMSNNGNVEYEGTNWFFTLEDTSIVADVAGDPSVGVSYQGKAGLKGLLGAPGMFIHVQGEARLVRDKLLFAKHWDESMDRWFKQGVDTPGLVLIEVEAKRIHYWDGEEEGEVKLAAPVGAF
jgi:general stress protein 26